MIPVGINSGLSLLRQGPPRLDLWLEGAPAVVVQDVQLLRDRMAKSRVDLDDILHAARERQGRERLDQLKYAELERGGTTIIPKQA